MSPRYSASGLFDDDATIPLDEDALVRPNLREQSSHPAVPPNTGWGAERAKWPRSLAANRDSQLCGVASNPELARRQAEIAAPFLDDDQLVRLRKNQDEMYSSVGPMIDLGTMIGLMSEGDDE